MNFRPILTTGKIVVLIAAVSMTSCKKDLQGNTPDSNAATLSDSSTVAESGYYDVMNNAIYAYSDNTAVMGASNKVSGKTTTFSQTEGTPVKFSCATYTVSDSTPGKYPKTLTLNFGTGCTSIDGVLRKGIIVYTFNAPLFNFGSAVNVTFNNYSVNGYGIQGSYTITNQSTEAGIAFNTVVTNGIVTYPDQSNYHYSHNKTYTQTAGASTPIDFSDDVYSITGNSAFSASGGASLVLTTSTPLIRSFSCLNITQGVVGFVYDGSVNGTIDFGTGTCDNLATLKVGSISRTITLR